MNVLIAEDEKTLAFFMKETIQETYPGVKVACVSTGIQALQQLQQNTYDLLITDLRLPGVGGLNLIETGRKTDPKLAIILMTAFATIDIEKRVEEMNIKAYLIKPFTSEVLIELLNPILKH